MVGYSCNWRLCGNGNGVMVCLVEAPYAGSDKPEKGRGVLCVIKEVGEVKGQ